MISARRTALIFGVLYLATFVFSIAGVLLYNPRAVGLARHECGFEGLSNAQIADRGRSPATVKANF